MSQSKSSADVPQQSWENPFPEGHPMHDLYGRRVRNQQDIVVIIDDYWNRRGTGKTIASLQLAQAMDQVGPLGEQNAHLDPEPFRQAYVDLEPRRGLILDEGEQAISNRNAMSKMNQEIRKVLSMGRVEEKYVIINAPSWNFLDKDVKSLATLWVTIVRKGIALIHEVKPHPYLNQILTPKVGWIQFEDIDTGSELRTLYESLSRTKRKKLNSNGDGVGYITESEHEKKLEDAVEDAQLETRNSMIKRVYEHEDTDITQSTLADIVDVTQPTVNTILND